MPRHSINDLLAFRAVAREGSFTRAAAQMGVSPSALSHAIRGLEERVGVRLLSRTTRSVALTGAGERLLATVGPRLDEIEAELEAVGELAGQPAGTIRITTGDHAAEAILWPVLSRFLRTHPRVRAEISVSVGFVDIVAERFDAGVRLGETIAQDMIAVPIGPDLRMAAVATPDYLARHGRPLTPHDLARHDCINLRMMTLGGLYAWEFEKDGRELKVWVEGQVVFNTEALLLQAALDGFGIAYLFEDGVRAHLEAGTLVRVLEDWCDPFPGYHLYFPSRREPPATLAVLIEALRHDG